MKLESSRGGARISPGDPRKLHHRARFQKNFKDQRRQAPRGAPRGHLSDAKKEAPRCSHNRSTQKTRLSCLRCRRRKFFATPLGREARFKPRSAQAAVRSLVLEHQKQRLWLQCGACLLKSGTLAREVSQKKKLTTPLARERRFSIKWTQAATRNKIHAKV